MKCTTCSKSISGKYRIAGRPYGYDCYRLKLAEIRASAELAAQEEKNAEHALKCAAAMAVFSGAMYQSEWLIKFQESIIQQWDDCRKLTAKQLSVILTKIDEVDYGLTYLSMAPEDQSLTKHIINVLAYRGKFTAEHINDERFDDLIRHALHNRERGTYVLQAVDDKDMALDVWGHVYEDIPLPSVAWWRLRIFHNLHPSQGDWFEDVALAVTHNLAYQVGVVSPVRRKSLGA